MIDQHILERYLEGQGSLQDKETIKAWFSGLGEERALREASFYYWENPGQLCLNKEKADQMLDRINHLIRLQEVPTKIFKRTGFRRTIHLLSRIAAVLFIPLAIFLWTLRDHFHPGRSPVISEIVCPPGTRTIFHLPDGSSGWLNGGSSLRFPMEFTGKTREVFLNGEGYFEVECSPRKPFIVQGKHITVKALGTAFNVMDYRDEDRIEVSLVKGNVDVMFERNGELLKLGSLEPGEVCTLDQSVSAYQIRKDDIDKRIAWKEGKLIFRDDNFTEVVRKCSRWYNVDIVIMDRELESYTYVGTFQDETLEEVLRLLSLTAPMEFIDRGRVQKMDGTFEKKRIELHFIN